MINQIDRILPIIENSHHKTFNKFHPVSTKSR